MSGKSAKTGCFGGLVRLVALVLFGMVAAVGLLLMTGVVTRAELRQGLARSLAVASQWLQPDPKIIAAQAEEMTEKTAEPTSQKSATPTATSTASELGMWDNLVSFIAEQAKYDMAEVAKRGVEGTGGKTTLSSLIAQKAPAEPRMAWWVKYLEEKEFEKADKLASELEVLGYKGAEGVTEKVKEVAEKMPTISADTSAESPRPQPYQLPSSFSAVAAAAQAAAAEVAASKTPELMASTVVPAPTKRATTAIKMMPTRPKPVATLSNESPNRVLAELGPIMERAGVQTAVSDGMNIVFPDGTVVKPALPVPKGVEFSRQGGPGYICPSDALGLCFKAPGTPLPSSSPRPPATPAPISAGKCTGFVAKGQVPPGAKVAYSDPGMIMYAAGGAYYCVLK